jgi:hypothetical protein
VRSIPDKITVVRRGRTARLIIDGEEFPFPTNGLKVDRDRNELPAVTVTIPAWRVELDDAREDAPDALDAG